MIPESFWDEGGLEIVEQGCWAVATWVIYIQLKCPQDLLPCRYKWCLINRQISLTPQLPSLLLWLTLGASFVRFPLPSSSTSSSPQTFGDCSLLLLFPLSSSDSTFCHTPPSPQVLLFLTTRETLSLLCDLTFSRGLRKMPTHKVLWDLLGPFCLNKALYFPARAFATRVKASGKDFSTVTSLPGTIILLPSALFAEFCS